jgi:hypothetical protein
MCNTNWFRHFVQPDVVAMIIKHYVKWFLVVKIETFSAVETNLQRY